MGNTLTRDEKRYIELELAKKIHKYGDRIGKLYKEIEETLIDYAEHKSPYNVIIKQLYELGLDRAELNSWAIINITTVKDSGYTYTLRQSNSYLNKLEVTIRLDALNFSRYEKMAKEYNALKEVTRPCPDLSKYYILFSTWSFPKAERLDKINELIDLIIEEMYTLK